MKRLTTKLSLLHCKNFTTKKKGSQILQNFVKLSREGNVKELEKYGFKTESGKAGYFNTMIDKEDEEFFNSNLNETDTDLLTMEKIDKIFEQQEKEFVKLTPDKVQKKFRVHQNEDEEEEEEDVSSVEKQKQIMMEKEMEENYEKKTMEIGSDYYATIKLFSVEFDVTDDEIVEWGYDFVKREDQEKFVYKYKGKERVLEKITPPEPLPKLPTLSKEDTKETEEEEKITVDQIAKFQAEYTEKYAEDPLNLDGATNSNITLKFEDSNEQVDATNEIQEVDTRSKFEKEMDEAKTKYGKDISREKLEEMGNYFENNEDAREEVLKTAFESQKVDFIQEILGNEFSKQDIEKLLENEDDEDLGDSRAAMAFKNSVDKVSQEFLEILSDMKENEVEEEKDQNK
eukprot:gene1959-1467_t